MDNQTVPNPVPDPVLTSKQVEVVETKPKSSPVLPVLLIILVLLLAASTAFLYYQNMQLKNMLASYQTQPVVSPTPITYQSPVPTTDPTTNWKTYINTKFGFSIKYPDGWRVVDSLDNPGPMNSVSFGPKQIGEDTLWGVVFYKKPDYSLDKIINDIGTQFSDRKQTKEAITVGGISATKVVTTTQQYVDWYHVMIIYENSEGFFAVNNGAIKDRNLPFNRGVPVGTTFEQFYSSFKFTK